MMVKTKDLVSFLLEHNLQQSTTFMGPSAVSARDFRRVKHPTEIAVLGCMDGRVHVPIMTQTAPGVLQPFRNIGGKFNLGWEPFGEAFREWLGRCADRGSDTLAIVTYHFSKGDHHRGCAGHGYDTAAAKACAAGVVAQIQRVYGTGNGAPTAILAGIETDEDGIVLHGVDGAVLDLAECASMTEDELLAQVRRLYPALRSQVSTDLAALLAGNLRHAAALRTTGRQPVDREHREQILAVGRGFEWLHVPNKALIVGPYSKDLSGPVGVAGQVLLGNLTAGRIPKEEGIVLLACASYRGKEGLGRAFAMEQALEHAAFALATVTAKVPDLVPYLKTLTGVVDQATHRFTRIDG
jgi:hypothetical protein